MTQKFTDGTMKPEIYLLKKITIKDLLSFPVLLALGSFVLGVVWRYWIAFYIHPASQYLSQTDMAAYVKRAIQWFNPTRVPAITDAFHPPGTPFFLGFLHSIDPTWILAQYAQWLLSALVPLVLALIAYELFDNRVALVTLIVSSLYYPFIKYAGYFLSENPFIFCLVFSMWLLVRSLTVQESFFSYFFALFSGLMFGISASFKPPGLVTAVLIGLLLIVYSWKYRSRRLLFIVLIGLIGLLQILVPLSMRCMKLSDGHFCLISNYSGNAVLMGHYGNLKLGTFYDQKRKVAYSYGTPGCHPHGCTQKLSFQFGCYESDKNLKEAWKWIRANPFEAIFYSVQHVFDLFTGNPLWPADALFYQRLEEVYLWLFWVFILLPVSFYIWQNFHSFAKLETSMLAGYILILPLIGLMISVFCTIGEVRYRIPFDAFLMILAARCWVGPASLKMKAEAENHSMKSSIDFLFSLDQKQDQK